MPYSKRDHPGLILLKRYSEHDCPGKIILMQYSEHDPAQMVHLAHFVAPLAERAHKFARPSASKSFL